MAGGVPVWLLTHARDRAQWELVRTTGLPGPQCQSGDDDFRMWSPNIESYIQRVFTDSAPPSACTLPLQSTSFDKRRFSPPLKENLQPLADLKSHTAIDAGGTSKSLSSTKRGILTTNSEACSGNVKRPRRFEAPSSEQSEFRPLFQTASMKSIEISPAALAKAKLLLGFDADTSSSSVPSRGLSNSNRSQPRHPLKRSEEDGTVRADGRPSVRASACMFQTARGQSVSISNKAMKRARALLGDEAGSNFSASRDEGSGCDVENSISLPRRGFFQTASARSPSASNNPVKQAADHSGAKSSADAIEASTVRFVTGGGKSVSVSSSAVRRARDLLCGELENPDPPASAHMLKADLCPKGSESFFQTATGQLIKVSNISIQRAKMLLGDESSNDRRGEGPSTSQQSTFENLDMVHLKDDSGETPSDLNLNRRKPTPALKTPICATMTKKSATPRNRVASFKAPRRVYSMPPVINSSCAVAPMQPSDLHLKQAISQLVMLSPLHQGGKERKSLQQFCKNRPHQDQEMGHLTGEVPTMTAETAKKYQFKPASFGHGLESVGSTEFRHMLLETGANALLATTEWVANHYRWIVWKLACLERSYSHQTYRKFLTIQTVFDELRYRYEREVNCGHRSALKRITEGDATSSWMMVLCVAAISTVDGSPLAQICKAKKDRSLDQCEPNIEGQGLASPEAVQIEVTDGWYSLNAKLDQPLFRQLVDGKIFAGQKLRVCGATLVGSTIPMPPLEAFQMMKLALHINGTYRAHWADRLGFCKGKPMPLAFHCIKHDGGVVPRTIVGINRIYPMLFCERLPNGCSITRSARAEEWAMRFYTERREQVAEKAAIRMEKEKGVQVLDKDMEEGARLFSILENAAEPELLMAELTAAQHAAFAGYQLKMKITRQALVESYICKALEEAHLSTRDVSSFLKVSVLGLKMHCNREAVTDSADCELRQQTVNRRGGLVTIWQVEEDQIHNLHEGAIYCVSDLIPVSGKSNQSRNKDVLHLRATKSTRWQLLTQAIFSSFSPRQALEISLLGTIPFCSEFDVAVLVLHVGQPYPCGLRRRQWLFVSDGSLEKDHSDHSKRTSVLVIDVSTSGDAFLPIEMSLEGCIIGYCNLVKRHQDQRNSLWVAEASEGSIYSSNLSLAPFVHLKAAAANVNRWAKSSESVVRNLRKQVHDVTAKGASGSF